MVKNMEEFQNNPQTKTRKDILGILNHTKEILNMTYKGFKKHNLEYLEKVKKIEIKLYKDSNYLIKFLLEAKSEEDTKQFLPIPGHFDRIGDGLNILCASVDKKISGDILFSDKSVSEACKLFDEILELLTCLSDCINTNNRVLAEYINNEGERLCELVDEYAIFHEERLIAGVCMPKSALIYLDILASFEKTLWHIREIAVNILAWGGEDREEKSK